MRYNQESKLTQAAKMRLVSVFESARRGQRSQAWLLEQRQEVFTSLHSGLPKWRVTEIRAFAEGYLDCLQRHYVVHLYTVDGKLYRLTNDTDPRTANLPAWDALPSYDYANLDGKGALHWIGGDFGIYFKSER